MSRDLFLAVACSVSLAACSPTSFSVPVAQTSSVTNNVSEHPTCVPTPTRAPIGTRTPTPTFPEPGTPWPTPRSGMPNFVTVTPFPFARITDLASGWPEEQKARFVVYRCNGSYELYVIPWSPSHTTITETLKLAPGDFIVTATYPMPSTHLLPPVSPPPMETRVMTLVQARQTASFHFFEPTYLPPGFRIKTVTRWDEPSAIPPQTGFTLEYIGPIPAGQASSAFLWISETYWPPQPTPPGGIPPPPPYETPQPRVPIHGQSALVDRTLYGPAWFTPEPPNQLYPALNWAEQNVFLRVGGSVSLDELIKIAQSLK